MTHVTGSYKRPAIQFLRGVFFMLLVVGVTSGALGAQPAKLTVVTTTNIVGDTVRRVVGDAANVVSLMGPGVDPHLYKATQGDLRSLTQANIIFYSGLHLEGKMEDVLKQMARRVPTFALTEYMKPDELIANAAFGSTYDPHVWFDVSLWIRAVERVRDAMIEVDQARADQYRGNAESFIAELQELDNEVAMSLAALPPERRVLVTAHDAFGYFGRRYGIEVVGLQGISTETEYGLSDVRNLVTLLVERNIGAVFVENSVSPRGIQAVIEGALARGHSVAIGGELFSDSVGATGSPAGTYIGMVRHNVAAIVAALK